MKFAIPTFNRQLTAHFGHCESFAIVNTENESIVSEEYLDPPVHQPVFILVFWLSMVLM